jgi:hypothetical protein
MSASFSLLPSALSSLLHFEATTERKDNYSCGFAFTSSSEKFMLKTYSEDDRFLNHLHEFAQADETGSVYALWQQEGAADLENAPVVIFGSEGGYHVVAANAHELLELLAADAEPMCSWDHVSYYRDPQADESPLHSEYLQWLRTHFALQWVRAANEIVSTAQKKHQQAFAEWMEIFTNP